MRARNIGLEATDGWQANVPLSPRIVVLSSGGRLAAAHFIVVIMAITQCLCQDRARVSGTQRSAAPGTASFLSLRRLRRRHMLADSSLRPIALAAQALGDAKFLTCGVRDDVGAEDNVARLLP